jgi:hypothetical protein
MRLSGLIQWTIILVVVMVIASILTNVVAACARLVQ